MSDLTFVDRTVLVTGGGTGIGRAAALAFAERGAAHVIITGRREAPLAEVARRSPVVAPVVADVATDQGAKVTAEAVRERGGTLDVLVHNAGILRITPVADLDSDAARELLEVNVLGPALLTSALLPLLRSPGGSIVLVSSALGHLPSPGVALYAASKAAVDSLTRTWAKELAPQGIRVNAVAPGTVRTPILESSTGLDTTQVEAIRADHDARVPLGRMGDVGDIAPWITRLAEPASSWLTGQILTVDGGWDLL